MGNNRPFDSCVQHYTTDNVACIDAIKVVLARQVNFQQEGLDPVVCADRWKRNIRTSPSLLPWIVNGAAVSIPYDFGALYQNDGVWKGKRIIPKQWMKESTTPYSEKDGAGFGYMWGILLPDTRLSEIIGGTGYFLTSKP